jgi:hypothetical protein
MMAHPSCDDRRPDVKLSLPRRLLRSLYRGLMAYGTLYTGVAPAPVPRLTGPGSAHPERVCAHVPLTPLERALTRELRSG